MTIQEIINYVMHTPKNTNPAVLKSMLEQLDTGSADIIWFGTSAPTDSKYKIWVNLDNNEVKFLHNNEWIKTVPTELAELLDDEEHRTVTDEQIESWNSRMVPEITELDEGKFLGIHNQQVTAMNAVSYSIDSSGNFHFIIEDTDVQNVIINGGGAPTNGN